MNLFIQSYIVLFERDINAVIKEISAYDSDFELWKIGGELNNSAGNLALHLIGNLRHFIGHEMGGNNYRRERHAEFNSRNVPREEIIHGLELALNDVIVTLENMKESQLESIFPKQVLGYDMTTAYFLSHLYGHLNYHLGQINYHRRLMV
ncbi:MAG: DinB family protein [Vicingaceae bacterium]